MVQTTDTQRVETLVGRLFESGVGSLELLTVYMGDKLGLYAELADVDDMSSAELAKAAGIDERYAREWLVQQAIAGFLDIAADDPDDRERRYSLPEEFTEVFLDPHSLAHMAPMPGFLVSFASVVPRLLDAYRNGDGISYADYGLVMRDSQGAFNRPHHEQFLSDWISACPTSGQARVGRRGEDRRHRLWRRLVEHPIRPRLAQRRRRGHRQRQGIHRSRARQRP